MNSKKNKDKMTQELAVLNHLKKYGRITSMEAFELYGCTRLSARIFDFRKRGYPIITNDVTAINRYGTTSTYAEYVLLRSKGKKHGTKSSN